MTTFIRQLGPAARALALLSLVLGLLYPLAITGLARAVPDRADGSLVEVDGRPVGSALLGQQTTGDEWFRGRPSANDSTGETSGGSNLGRSDPDQLAAIDTRRAEVAAAEGVDPEAVPVDALTASGSGLDPHISPEYAALQVPRVARATGLPEAEVRSLVAEHTDHALLRFLGADRVEVTTLNAALAARSRSGR